MKKNWMTLDQIQKSERARKHSYLNTGTPYTPRIYHLDHEPSEIPFPTRNLKTSSTSKHIYNPHHWMVGNIITNKKTRNLRKNGRDFAIWYSIDGRTSHYLTCDSFKAVSDAFEHFYLQPLVKEEPTESLLYATQPKILKQTSTFTITQALKRILEELRKRKQTGIGSDQKLISDLLKPFIVEVISAPHVIELVLDYIIIEHPKIIDRGEITINTIDGPQTASMYSILK